MKTNITHKLKIYSQTLEKDPEMFFDNLDIVIEVVGYDEDNNLFKEKIRFVDVLCHKHTSASFSGIPQNSYDNVIEIIDSAWLRELKQYNIESFNFWNPKHFAIYLWEYGLYEFIARKCNIEV